VLYEPVVFPDGIPLNCCVLEVEEEYPFHMHDNALEVIFVLTGAVELTVVNKVLRMEEGDIYIASTRELHRFRAYEDARGIVMLIHISLEAYRGEYPDLHTYQFANSALKNNSTGIQILGSYLKKQLPRLLDVGQADRAYLYLVGTGILNTLIKEFQCYYLGKGFPEYNYTYKGNEIQLSRIRRVMGYIYQNYNAPIKIEDVAAREHVTSDHLAYILKNGCGAGFRALLNMARAEQSAAMILEGGKGLQAIAYECGFSKYQYFNEYFEKVFRTSPQEYQKRYRNCTIAVRPPKVKKIEGGALDELLEKFCDKSEAIRLDLNGKTPLGPFRKPNCISLADTAYDHILHFPMLRQIRREIGFDTLELDLDFLRRYRNTPGILEHILTDLWGLRLSLLVSLPREAVYGQIRWYLDLLQRLSGRLGGPLELVLPAEGKGDRVPVLKQILAAEGFHLTETRNGGLLAGPLYSSGYMPCRLLHTVAQGDCFYGRWFPLLEKPERSQDNRLPLLTPEGVKKPAYHLLYLLARMGGALIARGDRYFATRRAGEAGFQIILFHYDKGFDDLLETETNEMEQTVFVELMLQDRDHSRGFSLHLEHITGRFLLRKYRITAQEYAGGFDYEPILSCSQVSEETIQVLNQTLAPEVSLELIEANGSYRLELTLTPFEIVLMCFEPL